VPPTPDPNPSYGADRPLREHGQATAPEGGSTAVVTRFRAAWADSQADTDAGTELLPTRLTQACLAVLPVDGAGLSLLDKDFRVPIGASDNAAALAERLQFTLGEGPCMDAAFERRVIVSDREQLSERWPLYAHELFTRTDFHGIAAIPLALAPETYAALDLFVTDSSRLGAVSLADVSTLGEEIVDALLLSQAVSALPGDGPSADSDPDWLRSPATRERTFVWVAMGMMMTEFDLAPPDALALLRSYAYSSGTDLDRVAAELTSGGLELDALRP
jgi:hypothetical protein